MNGNESTELYDSAHPPPKKRQIGERLKQLQEKTGDLCETLDRIEKALARADENPPDVRQ